MAMNNVRQYVGARYVPKFATPVEWQSNTAYEAMVIVTYNNSSYTSKIPVPASVGIPSDNPSYWALTGNYNAQVEQYRQETSDISTKLKGMAIRNLVTDYGVTPNVDTEIGDILQQALWDCYQKYILYIPKGKYNVNKQINVPNYTYIMGMNIKHTILNNCSLIANNGNQTVGVTIENLCVDCNYKFDYGVQIRSSDSWIKTVMAKHANVAGFYTPAPPSIDEYYNVVNEGGSAGFEHCVANQCETGFILNYYDGVYNDISAGRCKTGILEYGGGNYTNVHVWDFHNYGFQLYGRAQIDGLQIEGARENPTGVLDIKTVGSEISNLLIWNVDTSNVPLINFEANAQHNLISNLFFGKKGTILGGSNPHEINIRLDPTASYNTIYGTADPEITNININDISRSTSNVVNLYYSNGSMVTGKEDVVNQLAMIKTATLDVNYPETGLGLSDVGKMSGSRIIKVECINKSNEPETGVNYSTRIDHYDSGAVVRIFRDKEEAPAGYYKILVMYF